MTRIARLIAFYLPQYHPVPENDEWWGKGFTEWTNTAKAKPLFKGHYQPHIPADLGFYDLRVPETRIAQAEMARDYGIEAFCYYHYWFSGRRILERPFNEVLQTGEPKFPFCLCWANETWRGVWHGSPKATLIEQEYPGIVDHQNHFNTLLPAFTDDRYLKVNGKPFFVIYRSDIEDIGSITDIWREMAYRAGLKGLYLVGNRIPHAKNINNHGLDAFTVTNFPNLVPWASKKQPIKWLQLNTKKILSKLLRKPTIYSYEDVSKNLFNKIVPGYDNFPCLVPNWDNTPRSLSNGLVFHGSTPELFRKQVKMALQLTSNTEREKRIVFIKSWNEWAEGNHLEPDMRYGLQYLDVLRTEIQLLS